jgi:hypothetical protein
MKAFAKIWLEDIKMKTASNLRVLRTIPLVLIVGLLCSSAYGKIIYVDDDSMRANDGTSWGNAYNFLQDALADANQSDKPVQVLVAQGVYTPDSNSAVPDGTGDREATFRLINGVTLRGGYAGIAEPDPDARDVAAYETILSGDLNGDDVEVVELSFLWEEPTRAENSYHVVIASSTDETAVLNGFTITCGNADGPRLGDEPPYDYGLRHGGGMYNYEGSPTLTNCIFSGNSAGWGGGMCNMENSSPTLVNCTFIGNSIGDMAGGGMNNVQSNPTLIRCTFSGNSARHGGGMHNFRNSSPTLTNCTFSGNSAYQDGGGMYNERECSPTLTNCTFAQNSADYGNALACDSWASPSNVELVNCILWDGGDEIRNRDNSTIIATYSNIQGGFPGEGNIDTDPLFVDLGYWDPNGTPADESDDYWLNGDYHLRSQAGRWDPNSESWVQDDVTSPCIDAGDPMSPIGWESFPNGGFVNMGAYGGTPEASKAYFGKPVCETIVAGDINGDCNVDFEDLAILTSHWLQQQP